jgi:hypothetical protein
MVRKAADQIIYRAQYGKGSLTTGNVVDDIRTHLADALVQAEQLHTTFAHTHVACKPGQVDPPGYPDRCQQCGLDIRNEIHLRAATTCGEE